MSPDTIRVLLCLKEWFDAEIVREDHIDLSEH